MDEQSGESKEGVISDREYASLKWRNWYQNEADEEIKGIDSRDKVKRNERSHKLLLERMMSVAEQE